MDDGTVIVEKDERVIRLVKKAVEEEREACAKTAENLHRTYSAGKAESDSLAIARMIRARGDQ